jgi:CheY-like chemotaxis protein
MNTEISNIRVMIVDDSPTAALFLKQKFEVLSVGEELSINVSTCETGEEAVNQVENNAYDLIILDIVLPGMDGYETCRSLKSNANPNPIVVFLTALKDQESMEKAEKSGCDHFLTKPASDMNIVELLKLAAIKTNRGYLN